MPAHVSPKNDGLELAAQSIRREILDAANVIEI
jgi:hypothetical protein